MAENGSNDQDEPKNKPHDPWTQAGPVESDGQSQPATPPQARKGDWEHDLINRLAFASLNEQRRSRRWSVFFKSLLFVYLFLLLVLYFPREGTDIHLGDHTAVVKVEGIIAADAYASADNVIRGLRAAFKDEHTKGVILRINSPGGSPVQSGYVYDEIIRLRDKYPNIPVYAVVTDLCASAAYYIAAATDEIYANQASMVGSIGVLVDAFGFTGSMEKLGVERRLLTAGEHKGFLDPFSPLRETEKRHMEGVLQNVYQQFVSAVKQGRGTRLTNNPDIFSGLIWSGEQGVELGLVDGLGSSGYVARELVKAERLVDFTPRRSVLDQFAERVGASMANGLFEMVISPGLR